MSDSDNNIYLKKVFIKNLFNQKDISWDLDEDVNILGGINGSGKSTILNIIRLFFGNENGINTRISMIFNSAKFVFSNSVEIDFFAVESSDFATALQKIKERKLGNDPMMIRLYQKINLYCGYYSNKEGKEDDFIYNYITEDETLIYINSIEPYILPKDINSPIKKNIKSFLDYRLNKAIQKKNEIFVELNNNTNLYKVINKYKGDVDSLNNDPIIKKYIYQEKQKNKIQKIINSFFTSTHKKLNELSKFNFKLINYKTDKRQHYNSSFIFFIQDDKVDNVDKTDNPNNIISCFDLSTGEKQLLLLLLEVWNTQERNCILVMDEPDLGLHVDWKKRLIKTIHLINPNAQLILSTHAPSMIRGYFDKVKEISEIERYNGL